MVVHLLLPRGSKVGPLTVYCVPDPWRHRWGQRPCFASPPLSGWRRCPGDPRPACSTSRSPTKICWNQSLGHDHFFKNGPTRPLFCLFYFFSHDKCNTNLTINDKSLDRVFGIWTQGGRVVGIDKSTELFLFNKRLCKRVSHIELHLDRECLWKHTGAAVCHNRFKVILLDSRYQTKNKFKPSCKIA